MNKIIYVLSIALKLDNDLAEKLSIKSDAVKKKNPEM